MEDQYLGEVQSTYRHSKELMAAKRRAFIDGFTCGGISAVLAVGAVIVFGGLVIAAINANT